jgi:glucosamine 6-phosphate synthetase-like amidotransferase/phosphosugar isomerase protein
VLYQLPIALERALKLKEISYIHAEGYPAGEMKYGSIALLDARVPVVSIAVPGPPLPGKLTHLLAAQFLPGGLIE